MKYRLICLFAFIYLYLGFIYNIGIYTFWKTYLYDVKAFLYLTIPYFFLYTVKNNRTKIIKWFTPRRIFIYCIVASFIDWAIVNIIGHVEYPQYLHLPVIPVILPTIVSIVGFIYSKKMRYKLLFGMIFIVDCISAVNRLSLSYFFSAGVRVAYLFIVRTKIKLIPKYILVLAIFFLAFSFSIFVVYRPFGLVKTKSAGAITRVIQFENVLANFHKNIPMLIGKGLGSTWFEYIPISESDIYSVGTSVGRTSKEAMASPVKFIFNFGPAATLYKWGIMGTLILIFLIVLYFQKVFIKINWLNQNHLCSPMEFRYLNAVLIISFLFVLNNFTYIGLPGNSGGCSVLF